MKKNIHPKYDFVLYRCPGTGTEILTRSTKLNGPEVTFQGAKMPSIAVEICSDNHPFYIGKSMVIDTAGRVDAFKKRFAKSEAIKSQAAPKAAEAPAEPAPKPKPAPKQKRPEAELPKILKAQELERAAARAEKTAKGPRKAAGDKPTEAKADDKKAANK